MKEYILYDYICKKFIQAKLIYDVRKRDSS